MFECDICNKEFDTYRGLNGHKGIHRVGGRYKNSRRKRPILFCRHCKEEIKSKSRTYCSIKCQNAFQREGVDLEITNGVIYPFNRIRKFLNERNDNCQSCGIPRMWNNKPLTFQVDHIDGDKGNNSLDNLQVLCPNCHTQTETWGRKKNDLA